MKKIISVFLALVMILSLNTFAFANDTATLTIISDSVARTTRKYAGYQLLELTTSLKAGAHEHADGHTDACYNYAYTVNGKYREIFQKEVFDNGSGTKPASASGVTDTQILEYLAAQTGDSSTGTGTMRQVADRLYRAIKIAGITADKSSMTGSADTIEQGYWLIADVTNLTGNEANSLVIVDTKGEDNLVINPKTALPTVEKKVQDIDDSNDSNIADNAWQDSADHDMGDAVPFKLTGTLPENVKNYEEFKMIFHDTLSDGLTLRPESIRVYMYPTKASADNDADLNDYAKDVTNEFVKPTTAADTFEVSCGDVLKIGGVTKDTAFVVYYKATLNNTAEIGAAGNPNEVYLEFSNNPYGGGTGKTEVDKVTVFTYQVIVNKTDEDDKPLKGAGFKLYKKTNGAYVLIGEELKGADMTTFTWKGLDDGNYKLEESTVPDGYNKMSDIEFTISAVHEGTSLTSLDGGEMGAGVAATGAITKDIENKTGMVLPETGARGTAMLIGISSALVAVAAIFMITRKKMSIYED